MKYKVAELEGAQLDAAVAKAEGLDLHPGPGVVVHAPIDKVWAHQIQPSTRWQDGGPIIERERINVGFDDQGGTDRGMWCAYLYDGDGSMWFADTFLIAAMRAYVASKFGEEVDLP